MMSKTTETTEREAKRLYSSGYASTVEHRDEKQRLFCESLEEFGSVADACRAAGLDRSTAYRWQGEDKTFAKAWDDAFQVRLDALEKALFKRGEDTSDRAAFGMLKAHRRETYGDKVEVTRKGRIILDWPEGEKGEE